MRALLPLLAILSSVSTLAAEAPVAQPIKLDKELARTVDPTTQLNLSVYSLGFLNSSCTGTLISPKGHLLVASHCIDPSIGWGDKQPKHATGFPTVGTLTTINEVQKDAFYVYDNHVAAIAKTLTIPLGLDGSTVYASIVSMGRGSTTPLFESELKNSSPQLVRTHRALLNNGYGEGGDFAIVQIPELAGHACYRLSTKPVSLNSRIHSTSFPCYKDDGDWPQVRNGLVNNLGGASGAVAVDGTDFYLPKGTFTTDAPAQECNSGTAAMNIDGEIVGVLDAIYPNNRSLMSSFYLSTARLLELMPPETREQILNLNSTCSEKP